MKVLLLKPPVEVGQVYNVIPPIGLGYLAAHLREQGHDVNILDAIRDNLSAAQVIDMVSREAPQVLGYQTFSYDVGMVREISGRVKSGGLIQMIGGPHPSGMRQKVLRDFPDIDYAVAGEGETSFPDLLKVLDASRDPSPADLGKIPGLVWRGMDPSAFSTPCFEADLDKLGFPAWDLHKPKDYPFAPQGAIFRQYPFAPLIITRGCPYPCTFCAGHTLSGKKYRHRSIGHVVEEMRMLSRTWGVREFHILDDNFSLDREYFMQWCQAVAKELHGITWCAPNGMRLDTLDTEVVEAMKKSGCYYVSVGVESGSDRILKHMRKGFTTDEIRERVAMIRKTGLEVNGFFIIGYPEETAEDIEATIRLAVELDLSRAAFFNFLPLPGTPIFDELYPDGAQPSAWDTYFQYNAPYAPKGMSSKDLKNYQRRAHLKFYFRPKIMWRMLREIRSARQVLWILRRASKILGAGADIIKIEGD